MATATKDRPANGSPQQGQQTDSAGGTTAPNKPAPLWAGMRIPVILLSAEVNGGKTIFPIVTDPACRTFDHDPTVIVMDQEGSAETYAGQLNFEWFDTRAAVFEGRHRQVKTPDNDDPKWRKILLKTADVNDSPAESLFRAWYMSLLEIPPKKYRVGSADTFTKLQDGMIGWLRRHPEAFGRSAAQYSSAASMFLWPDAKDMLSYILSVDCRLRFETFCMTVHLKNEWKGNSKTGERIAEGLDVLDKLCTLHLRLDRTAKSKAKSAPRLPSAIVIKQRLVRFGANESEDRPILPPRIPECTPDAIRAYILNPPDFNNLKPDERLPDDALTDDQKIRLQAQVSENNLAAAELNLQTEQVQLTRMEKMKQAAERQAASRASGSGGGSDSAGSSGVQGPAGDPNPGTALATDQQIAEIRSHLSTAFANGDEIVAWLGTYGVAKIAEMSESQAADALIDVLARSSKAKQAAAAEKLAGSGGNGSASAPSTESTGLQTQRSPDAPTMGNPPEADTAETGEFFNQSLAGGGEGEGGSGSESSEPTRMATDEQIAVIRPMLPVVFATNDDVKAYLSDCGVKKLAELTLDQADRVIEDLQSILHEREQTEADAAGASSSAAGAGPGATNSTSGNQPHRDADGDDYDISRAEMEQIMSLCSQVGWDAHDQSKWLKERSEAVGKSPPFRTFRDIKSSDAQALINKLMAVVQGFNGGEGLPGN